MNRSDKAIRELQEACGYSDGSDGEESDVDSLIAYKDALEDAYATLVEKANLADVVFAILDAPGPWSPDTLEDISAIYSHTGYVFRDNAEE